MGTTRHTRRQRELWDLGYELFLSAEGLEQDDEPAVEEGFYAASDDYASGTRTPNPWVVEREPEAAS